MPQRAHAVRARTTSSTGDRRVGDLARRCRASGAAVCSWPRRGSWPRLARERARRPRTRRCVPPGGTRAESEVRCQSPAGRRVVVDGDLGQRDDAARRVLGGRDRLQPDAEHAVDAEFLEVDAASGNSPGASASGVLGRAARDPRRATAPAPRSARRAPRAAGTRRDHRARAPRRRAANRRTRARRRGRRRARHVPRPRRAPRGCASATAAGKPTAAIRPRSGVSSTRQATRRASTALRARSSASARALSPTPWRDVGDAEFAHARGHRGRAPAGNHRDADAGGDERLDAVAVAHVERLERLAVGPNQRRPSVSTPSTSSTTQRDRRRRARHITPARSRSCTLSAPTRRPASSITSRPLTRVLLHHEHGLGRELVRADRARAARHDVGHAARRGRRRAGRARAAGRRR